MRIKQLQLLTPSLADTVAFYADRLHLPVLDESYTSASFRVGHSTLTFHQTQQDKPFYHFAFTIPHNQVSEALSWISAKTPVISYSGLNSVADFPNWNARAFYFHDPSGNIVECIARFDLDNASDTPFNAASMLGISEIGIPVDSVALAGLALTSTNGGYGLPYFSRGPVLQDFAAVGDDQGLLLLTSVGRGWLPTQRPAERHPMAMTLQQERRLIELELSGWRSSVTHFAT